MGTKEMIYGMSRSCFDWALLWTGREALVRRPGFPSWSWVGWTGQILMSQDTFSSYDQDWLIKGTWIDWSRFDDGGRCTFLWDSNESESGDTVSKGVSCIADSDVQSVGDIDATDTESDADAENGVQDKSIDSGEDMESDEDDIEIEHCPTYGHSCNTNPFGRCINERSLHLLGPRPTASLNHALPSCPSKSHSGLLYFLAPLVNLRTGSLLKMPRPLENPVLPLYDGNGCVSGALSADELSSWPNDGMEELQLLILSVTAYGDISCRLGPGQMEILDKMYGMNDQVREAYLEKLPDHLDNYDFLNMLWIRKTKRTVQLTKDGASTETCVHERAGLGFIQSEALDDVGGGGYPTWTEIILG